MLLICIASALVCSAAAEFSVVVSNPSVSARLGSSVVLPCSFSPPVNARPFEVQWYKYEEPERPVLLYQDQKVQKKFGDEQHRAGASLTGNLDQGDVSLTLKNLTVADAGEYVCFVQSSRWFEKGSMILFVQAISGADMLVNVTRASGGWSQEPPFTWTDGAGRDLASAHTHYGNDPWSLYVPLKHTEDRCWILRFKVSLTLDPSTAEGSLKVSSDRKSVSCKVPSSGWDSRFPSVVSQEELGPGQHYWEVMVWDEVPNGKRKSSWCVGVTQKTFSENIVRALCYESGVGLYPNTDRSKIISREYIMPTVGLLFNIKMNTLCFFSEEETFRNPFYMLFGFPPGNYFAFFSPGVKDDLPLRIVT